MNRLASIVVLLALVGVSAVGCTKSSSSDQGANATASGPVTDSASPGKKGESMMPAAGDAAHGKQIFTQNCASCHGATGTEGGVGPSLKNEKARKNTAAAIVWIKDPKPPMPKMFPSPLSEKDVSDVAAYVESL